MNTVMEGLIEDLASYQHGYMKEGLQVPECEIVMHPASFYELMDNKEIVRHIDINMSERNFHGVVIITNPDYPDRALVRDRTTTQ